MRLRNFLPTQCSIIAFYQRFESLVAFLITLLITIVVAVTLYRLFDVVVNGIVLGALDPLDQRVFQNVFGEIMTVLIALEFNNTLQYVVTRRQSIKTKVILLIALLVVARKFIIMDLKETSAESMFGLAAIALSLGIVYWLLRERDDRLDSSQGRRNPGDTSTDSQS
ncbi:MAG TPA: phosphate-starvation-inducible PsiE family protein [Syntrophorhabdaceae bacterium]|nr:phosphate-starvation-inducible PsiE family protein [Syntrophorhabdaceae bacterium]